MISRPNRAPLSRALMAVALVCVVAGLAPWSASAQDRPAIEVDLSVLDALSSQGGSDRPSWRPPIPRRRPTPPIQRQRPILAEPESPPGQVADPLSVSTQSARLVPAALPTPPRTASQRVSQAIPRTVSVSTAPVNWRRPIPVTANASLIQQVGARSTGPVPSVSDKLIGANVDVEATADIITALPNGDGFRMLFVNDHTALSATGERLLDTLAERMDKQADLRLSVLAYAGGSPETATRSRLLSLERALAVRNYLSERGVRGSRMDLRALGNTYVDGPPERVDLLLLAE